LVVDLKEFAAVYELRLDMADGHSDKLRNPRDDWTRSSGTLRAQLARQLDEPATTPPNPPPIPDHSLLCRIGSGACGEVWLARSALGTMRAVKIVYRSRFKEDRPYEREFDGILKYEPISRTHDGLVQVLHVGRNDAAECFYYVMELADAENDAAENEPGGVKGHSTARPDAVSADAYRPRTLRSEQARHQRLPPVEAARLALRLASSLAHLHDQGLVHRDIKPSNVIFVSGKPKLADIGLVTDVGSSHSFVGTEGFIPPEGPGTPQADLYALGKLLYELAAGRDRLDFPQLPVGVSHVRDGEALLELNEVITRACAPDPRERYATATQLQAELNLFLAGRSLRRNRTIERGLARLKKVAAVACVVMALTTVALWYSLREQRHSHELALAASERAVSESVLRRRAQAAERESQQQLYTALLEQARATVRSGEPGQRVDALDAIRRAAAISNRVELRREVLAALALPDIRFERELRLEPGLTLFHLDSTFERIAICRGRGPVEIRAVADDRLLATLPASTNHIAYNALWSRDDRYLTVTRDHDPRGFGSTLEVWQVEEPRLVLLVHDGRWNARSYHPHKPQLLTAGPDGVTVLWDLESGTELSRRSLETTPRFLDYSPTADRVVAAYQGTNGWHASIHSAADGTLLASRMLPDLPSKVIWQPGGEWIAITDFGSGVHLLDSRNGELHTLGTHKAEATTAVFSPDGHYLMTGGWERELICWDMRTRQRAMTISIDSYFAMFRSDGRACALLTPQGLQFHAFEPPTVHRRFSEYLGPRLWDAAFSPDGRWLAASADKSVGVWDLTANAPGALVDGGAELRLFWSPKGDELLGSSRDEDCFRWRLHSATNRLAPPTLERVGFPRPEGFVSFHLSSNHIVWTGSRGARMTSLDETGPHDGDWMNTVQGFTDISPDGRLLAVARGYAKELHIYRLPDMLPVASLTNPVYIAGFSFSPAHAELGVGSRGRLEFWNTETWERTRSVTNFLGIPYIGMLYEPDGRTVWLVKDTRTAGLYDLRSLEPILFLPTGMVPLALSPDGNQLAVSVDAQRLALWDLEVLRQHFRDLGLDWSEQ
jgi:WD40 repeat protein